VSEIRYEIVKKANKQDVANLYRKAGWWSEKNDKIDFLDDLIASSYLFVCAYDGEELIGMGRSLSDGISDAYIQDVTVLKDYRRRGIGGAIVRTLVENLYSRGIRWIGLIGEPGTQHFYEELDFRVMQDYIPMQYKGKK
jgi:spermidine synthase